MRVRNRSATAELPPFKVKAGGRGGVRRECSIRTPDPVVTALVERPTGAPEGVSFMFLTARRFETVKRNRRRCQDGLHRERWSSSRAWQDRDIALNTFRALKKMAQRAGLKLTAPLTVCVLRKSYGRNHAEGGTPIHVLQRLMGHSSITATIGVAHPRVRRKHMSGNRAVRTVDVGNPRQRGPRTRD